jgi:hypothetical protein
MAKIGQLVLAGGRWNNRQIVSREWIDTSTAPKIKATEDELYGYLWWLGRVRAGRRFDPSTAYRDAQRAARDIRSALKQPLEEIQRHRIRVVANDEPVLQIERRFAPVDGPAVGGHRSLGLAG